MHCKHIEKQTKGEVSEIELDGLSCNLAQMCRRKGICVLSPFSYPAQLREKGAEEQVEPSQVTGSYYEVLRFKNSLGFQWIRAESFARALQAAEKFAERGQPKYIRRVEIMQIPD